jgi:hypothetical protein
MCFVILSGLTYNMTLGHCGHEVITVTDIHSGDLPEQILLQNRNRTETKIHKYKTETGTEK